MGSSIGRVFRVTTFGESHGGGVGVVVEGCPPGLHLDEDDVQPDLDRRRPGQSRLVTQRDETDTVEILSGVSRGVTLGSPIAMLVRNRDQNPGAYDHLRDLYRPSHADYTTEARYGVRAVEGGGRSSARETVARVAAGAVARKLLRERVGVEVLAWVAQIHSIVGRVDPSAVQLDHVEASATRCPDPEAAEEMVAAIEAARRDGDSLGGIVAVVARGVPPGWGDPVFDKLEADLAKAVMSLPASKGVEVGSGFSSVTMTGREHNDAFVPGPGGRPRTATNNSGGIQGGISNGEDVLARVAFKPTATISSEQDTVTRTNEPTRLAARGRHDPCVLPRAVPMVEAAVLLVLCDHWLRHAAVHPGS